MNTLKPLLIVAVLAGIGYGVYVRLNAGSGAPPPPVEPGWNASPSVQLPGQTGGAPWANGVPGGGAALGPAAWSRGAGRRSARVSALASGQRGRRGPAFRPSSARGCHAARQRHPRTLPTRWPAPLSRRVASRRRLVTCLTSICRRTTGLPTTIPRRLRRARRRPIPMQTPTARLPAVRIAMARPRNKFRRATIRRPTVIPRAMLRPLTTHRRAAIRRCLLAETLPRPSVRRSMNWNPGSWPRRWPS